MKYTTLLCSIAMFASMPGVRAQTVILGARNVCAFSGATVGAKIIAAIASLPASGGTIDARCFDSSYSAAALQISSNVFSSGTQSVTLLLGAAQYGVSATQTLTNGSRIIGLGRGPGSTSTQLVNNGISNGAILVMGDASPSFGVQIEALSVACQGQTYSSVTGILNQAAEERSWVRDVSLYGCNNTGLSIYGSGAQNSGLYSDLEIYATGMGITPTSTCISANGTPALRGITDVTCIGYAGGSPPPMTNGIYISGSATSVENIHCEGVQNCLNISSDDVMIRNVQGVTYANSVTNLVYIPSGLGVRNISIFDVNQGSYSTNAIVDGSTTPATVINDPNTDVGFYFIGETYGNPSIVGTRLGSPAGSPNIVTFGSFTAATLPNSADGSVVYCTNCTPGAACAATGTGALAVHQHGAWVCK